MTVKTVTLDEWSRDFSAFMVSENLKLLKAWGHKRGGDKVVKKLINSFLESFVERIVTEALREKPVTILTEEANYEFTSKNFLQVKLGVQNAIADGFSKALDHFSNTKTDYFCYLTTVPEPVSKNIN